MCAAYSALADGWARREVTGGGETMCLLTRTTGNVTEVLPAAPRLARDAAGHPLFSATVMLQRQPRVADVSIEPLIQSGLFGFTLSLAVPEPIRYALGKDGAFRPVFVRLARFGLHLDEAEIQSVEATGIEVTAAFSLSLSRPQSLQMLEAARGADAGHVVCEVQSSVDEPACELRLYGRLAEIHAAMAAGGKEPFDRAALEARVLAAMESGDLTVVSRPEGATVATITTTLLKAAPRLVRNAPGTERFVMGEPPGNWQQLDVTMRSNGGPRVATLRLETPLGDIFGEALGNKDFDRYFNLVVTDGKDGATPANNRTRQTATRAPSRGVRPNLRVARRGNQAISLASTFRPQSLIATNAHVLLAASQPEVTPTIPDQHDWYVDDLLLEVEPDANQDESLPQIDDMAAPLWPDKRDPARRWYAPAFTLMQPDPARPVAESPFTFVFEAKGHTASGALGLEGEVRFRLVPTMSDAAKAAWEAEGRPEANPLPLDGLSVLLDIPYRDTDGVTRTQSTVAEVTRDGDAIVATVRLLDDWLRLAYGALAMPGFQAKDAFIRIGHTFRAYVPVANYNFDHLVFTRNESLTYLNAVPERIKPQTLPPIYLDTNELALRKGSSSLQFKVEEPLGGLLLRRALKAGKAKRIADEQTAAAGKPRAASRLAVNLLPLAVKPNLVAPLVIGDLIRKQRYAIQTRGRDVSTTAFFPCSTLGAFYLQEDEAGERLAVGCRDALTLGETELRLYERIEDLDDPAYTVWRSLQQPGRFLLLPARFVIGRCPASGLERAFRPTIMLYSTVDVEEPANNQCVALASLVPDVSPVARRRLEQALKALAERPALSLVNEIEAELTYEWAAAPGFTVSTVRQYDGFQVSIGSKLDFAPQLQAMLEAGGMNGSARFALPDGTDLEAGLVLDLNSVCGPDPTGPVTAVKEGTRCTLTNELSQPINALTLWAQASDRVDEIQVNRRLEPKAKTELLVAADVAELLVDTAPVTGSTATLEEIRSFVEDIHTNVIFVNLVNFANHGLKALVVTARLRGLANAQSGGLSEQSPVHAFDFVSPLTAHLAGQTLEFNATKTMTDGTETTTGWLAWDLATLGNVISLTWDMIA